MMKDLEPTYASCIVTETGEVYAKACEHGQIVKRRSALPCPWYVVRESFRVAYMAEFADLLETVDNSFHHVYRELSYFVNDDICDQFEESLEIAVQCRMKQDRSLGLKVSERVTRRLLAGGICGPRSRKEVWDSLIKSETECPREHLVVLAETIGYCGTLWRLMWDEWAAYATFVAFLHKAGLEGHK